MATETYDTLVYAASEEIATITLNRPERLNTIVPPMPAEVEAAVGEVVADARVKVIVLRGAGRAFCAGYDFAGGFEHWPQLSTDGEWDPGKDFAINTSPASPHQQFMSIWRAPKPVIAQVDRAAEDGVRSAVADRDAGFGDYSQAPPERQPDPANVIGLEADY